MREESHAGDGNSGRISEWEIGLPSDDDLTPLSQHLIPPELASAFSISPEPERTLHEVNRASQNTVSTIRLHNPVSSSAAAAAVKFPPFPAAEGGGGDGDDDNDEPSASGAILKRPRLVWTPQLHKRFVEVVAHLDVKSAVPMTIAQLMNVEGLTRENVASHLQKYRLYLKRVKGLSED